MSAIPPGRRPWNVRRTRCGPECGGWIPRTAKRGEPVACSGWHRNKRLYCEADAKFAITHVGDGHSTFFRCASCARSYRHDNALAPEYGLPERWVIERLMGPPPKALHR